MSDESAPSMKSMKRHPLMDEEFEALERVLADDNVPEEKKAMLKIAKYALDWWNNPAGFEQPSEYFTR